MLTVTEKGGRNVSKYEMGISFPLDSAFEHVPANLQEKGCQTPSR